MQEQLVVDGVTVVNLRNQIMQNPGLYATDAQLFVLLDHINELRTINASLHKRLDKDMGNFVNRNIALTPRGGEEENVGDYDGDAEPNGMGLQFSDLDGAHHVSNNDGSESVKIKNSSVSGTVSNPSTPRYKMRRTIHGVPLPIKPLSVSELALVKDAQRWRRLVKCGRIHVFGTSGFKNDAVVDPLQPYHFGVEFHAIHNAEQNPWDLQILTNFADALEVTNFSGVVGLWHKLGHFPTRDEVIDNLKSDKGELGFKAFCKMIEVPMSFQQEQILDTIVDNKP